MRRAKDNRQVPKRYYRPEQTTCPRCGQTLKRCYSVWRKYIIFLDGRYLVVSLGYRCPDPNCAGQACVYESQAARHLTVRGSSFALEVIVQILESLDGRADSRDADPSASLAYLRTRGVVFD